LTEALVNLSGVCVAVLRGPRFVHERVNAAYRALAPHRAMLGRSFAEVWPELDVVLPKLAQVAASGEPLHAPDLRVELRRTPDGPLQESYFSFSCASLPDITGPELALAVNLLDSTELVQARKRAEVQALERGRLLDAEKTARREAEQARGRAELLAQITGELNQSLDLPDVIHAALVGAARLLGGDDGALLLFDPDRRHLRGLFELWDRDLTDTVLDLAQLPQLGQALSLRRPVYLTSSETQGEETTFLSKDGIVSCIAAPMFEEDEPLGIACVKYRGPCAPPSLEELGFAEAVAGQCALAISRARAFKEERTARSRAEQMGKLQEQLLAVVGHDLRTPLASIFMGTDTLLRRGLPADHVFLLSRVRDSASRMSGMIRDLLDFSRVRQGNGIPMSRSASNLATVCDQALFELRQIHPEHRITLDLRGDTAAQVDPARMHQVVANLVSNAVTYGTGSRVAVAVASDGPELRLSVHNDGPPIPREVQSELFQPFRRGANQQGELSRGLGLGLFIVREIVRAHQGTVEVDSAEGRGTTFTVRIPRATPDASSSN
jgi:signal transduction histidine kinase